MPSGSSVLICKMDLLLESSSNEIFSPPCGFEIFDYHISSTIIPTLAIIGIHGNVLEEDNELVENQSTFSLEEQLFQRLGRQISPLHKSIHSL
jgi:hypothetical protein